MTSRRRDSYERHPPRTERPDPTSRTPRSEPTGGGGRRRDHPVFYRENLFRQVHQDANTTVYTREKHAKAKSKSGPDPARSRKEPTITLRSRSKSRNSKRSSAAHVSLFERQPGVQLRAKARPGKTRAIEDAASRGASASEATEATSQQVGIPTASDFEEVDYRRPSQKHEEGDEDDEFIPIPKPSSMDEDWKITVQKAFADPTRTKAPCEIPAHEATTLTQTISKKEFMAFQRELQARNPKNPSIVTKNMASIFAQSGKMNIKQARDSYEFTIPNMTCYGLFVPTYFKPRPPFADNDSNVYRIIHGTTNKGASAILAEELIRPGDFTMHQDPMQCGYPSYGFDSAGQVTAKTIPFSNNIVELSRKILRIGKGTLPVKIAGIYTGRHQHHNQMAGGNEATMWRTWNGQRQRKIQSCQVREHYSLWSDPILPESGHSIR